MRALVVLIVALVLAAPAAAGGWATAGLGPPPPGTGVGDTWNAEVTILQHGQTPLEGATPAVIITNAETGVTKRFAAKPTGKPGVYQAKVVFPSGGEWNYAVYDGFTAYGGAKTHTFAPIQVGGGTASSAFPLVETIGGVAVALVLAAALFLLVRRQRPAARVAPSA